MQTKSPSLKRPQIYAVRGGNIWARMSDHVDLDFHVRDLWKNYIYMIHEILKFEIHVTEP